VNESEKIFPEDRMTSRERLLAAYRGRDIDRLPFWPKVTNATWRSAQSAEVQALSDGELLDLIGADGIFFCATGVRVHRPHVHQEFHHSDECVITVTHTPDGDLDERWDIDPDTTSRHPTVFAVKTLEDLKRYRWMYADAEVVIDQEQLTAARAQVAAIGERGIVKTCVGPSPLMQLVEYAIGVVETHAMLADFPDEMAELMDLMGDLRLRQVEAVAKHTPADMVLSIEDTSTTLISPGQFERFCLEHLSQTGRIIESAGPMHEVHQCGQLQALLERIDTIPAAGIEAFTSPPLGDATLADGRRLAPSKCLVGGTNVMTWLTPPERIEAAITDELAACDDHRRIVLTTAGVAPSGCPAEVFRRIARWLATMPVRM